MPNKFLQTDREHFGTLLAQVCQEAQAFLEKIDQRPADAPSQSYEYETLPNIGFGAHKTLEAFAQKYLPSVTGSAGPRFFGFVTGGATPAAVAGDWLVSAFDQNASGESAVATHIERETIGFLRQMFHLSDDHSGTFVSGATMSNFVGLALARQWAGHETGMNVAREGLPLPKNLNVFSGAPHSCIFKALSMLGIGGRALQLVPCLPGREAIDINELRKRLSLCSDHPCVVVANAGTVNSVDFDSLNELARLKDNFCFWLHVDAAFGGFAACSPRYQYLTDGLDMADSIAIDAHKWLNVPYDSAIQFTRHRNLQIEVFQNYAPYLGDPADNPEFVHLTPENSRRLRALPAWFSLMAYGKAGYCEIVEKCADLAKLLGEKIESSNDFFLLAPVRLNVVCFALKRDGCFASFETLKKFLALLHQTGAAYFTPTIYKGAPGIRAAFVNWRTAETDIEIASAALTKSVDEIRAHVSDLDW